MAFFTDNLYKKSSSGPWRLFAIFFCLDRDGSLARHAFAAGEVGRRRLVELEVVDGVVLRRYGRHVRDPRRGDGLRSLDVAAWIDFDIVL